MGKKNRKSVKKSNRESHISDKKGKMEIKVQKVIRANMWAPNGATYVLLGK